MTLLLCSACALGGFVLGVLCGCVLCALLVGKGVMSLAQHKADMTDDPAYKVRYAKALGRMAAQDPPPSMTSTWHPGAETN